MSASHANSGTILWFRQDLRLSDNPALQVALQKEGPVYCLFIKDETLPQHAQLGGAAQWWLSQSLTALDAALRKRGNRLLFYRGNPQQILTQTLAETGAQQVLWNRCYDPHRIQQDTDIKKALQAQGITVQSFNSHLLFEPWTVLNQAGLPYKVFTPFWQKGCLSQPLAWPAHHLAPKNIPAPRHFPAANALEALGFPHKAAWAKAFPLFWQPGEQGAQQRLRDFVETGLDHYKIGRDFPGQSYVSGLSAHLHWGEIAPWHIWQTLERKGQEQRAGRLTNIETFQKELGWREFSYYQLYHYHCLSEKNVQSQFNAFPWCENPAGLQAWQQGQTGYPLVDAGMRQLWQTGWMHNRVRMVVASFLVKDLRLHWHKGAAWFLETLVDADLASNSANWQWVAGCGADAAPYFRIFNPITQSEKFDPQGDYIRQWVPELALLENKALHCPWKASPEILKKAGVVLGENYPYPILDHDQARKEALAAYRSIQ